MTKAVKRIEQKQLKQYFLPYQLCNDQLLMSSFLLNSVSSSSMNLNQKSSSKNKFPGQYGYIANDNIKKSKMTPINTDPRKDIKVAANN